MRKLWIEGADGARPNPGTYAYRYEDVSHSSVNEFDEVTGHSTSIQLRYGKVDKFTPKGFRVKDWVHGSRLVLHNSRKKAWHLSIPEARASFIARKRKQASIYRSRLKTAEKVLAFVEADNWSGTVRSLFGSQNKKTLSV